MMNTNIGKEDVDRLIPVSFVELNRQFQRVGPNEAADCLADTSYLFRGQSKGSSWQDILALPLVVILGEPGSGKTWEMRHRVSAQRLAGQQSFYFPLESLIDCSLPDALVADDKHRFEEWRSGRSMAWFYFDAVDEAKLRRSGDFAAVVANIGKVITKELLGRAALVFSSRISEWRAISDMRLLADAFPQMTNIPESAGGDASEVASHPSVFRLLPLAHEQVATYAQIILPAEASPQFLAAVDSSYVWDFTGRPLDLNTLISYWSAHGVFGRLGEMIEHGVCSMLEERVDRARDDNLTPERARSGADALAAASFFCRKLKFWLHDDAALCPSDGMDPAKCLSTDWSAGERRALLSRRVFDGATYGCVRFHHRRVTEFLAASWLNQHMHRGCSFRELKDLLFGVHRDARVLRPTMAPVAAWLSIGVERHNEYVRVWLLEWSPETHLSYGDPAGLPVLYRKQVLQALVERYHAKEVLRLSNDREVLARLAHSDLAVEIRQIALNRELPQDLRRTALLMIRQGRLASCCDGALDIIRREDETDGMRQMAVSVIRDIGSHSDRVELLNAIQPMTSMSAGFARVAIEALFPDAATPAVVVALLARAVPPHSGSIDAWSISNHLKSVLTAHSAGEMLAPLLELAVAQSRLPTERKAGEFKSELWVVPILPCVILRLLQADRLTETDAGLAARALANLNEWHTRRNLLGLENDTLKELVTVAAKHTILRRSWFWMLVGEGDYEKRSEALTWRATAAFSPVFCLTANDMKWMINESLACKDPGRRKSALNCCLRITIWHGMPRGLLMWLIVVQCRHPQLMPFARRAFVRQAIQRLYWGPIGRLTRLRYRMEHGQLRYWVSQRFNPIRQQWFVITHLRGLATGHYSCAIAGLVAQSAPHDSNEFSSGDWHLFRKRHGGLTAWVVRRGAWRVWRKLQLPLMHEDEKPDVVRDDMVFGLQFLHMALVEDPDLFHGFSEADADLAFRCAAREMNEFPGWLASLASTHGSVLRDLISRCVTAEWRMVEGAPGRYSTVTRKLARAPYLWPMAAPGIYAHLWESSPVSHDVLDPALAVLVQSNCCERLAFAGICSVRVPEVLNESPCFVTWMQFWLEVDAPNALEYLRSCLEKKTPEEGDRLMVRLADRWEERGASLRPVLANPSYLRPQVLAEMIPLVYRHIRPQEDIRHESGGAYAVGPRDHAQRFRDGLVSTLASAEDPAVPVLLDELAKKAEMEFHQKWFGFLREQAIGRLCDLAPWSEIDTVKFSDFFTAMPHNSAELFQTACRRFEDLKESVEWSENSVRDEVHADWNEAALRRWLQRKLLAESRGVYTMPQEAEVDLAQRADLRFERPGIAAIPVELKWADEQWSAADLLERLENQLVGQYLRAESVRHGIYVLATFGRKTWKDPTTGVRIEFKELVSLVDKRARELELRPGVDSIAIIALDFVAQNCSR